MRADSISTRCSDVSAPQPASYVAFDVLAIAGRDVRRTVLEHRRALLEELASTWTPLDVFAGAVIGPMSRPEAVVVGLPVAGELRIAGRFQAEEGAMR